MAENRETIVAHACCRVDLAGGTLDIWPLYLFHPGAVTVNFGVNILTRSRIAALPGKKIRLKSIDTQREETFADFRALCSAKTYKHPLAAYLVRFFEPRGGFEIETNSESPAGAGISGSSALMVATTAALAKWTGRHLDREQIRSVAQNVEAQLIKVPTGCQDYYPALYGGVNAIHLEPDGIHREAIPVPAEEIEARFVLAYTGAPRQSGINNWKVFQAHINGDCGVMRNFEQIGEIARGMHTALARGAWREVGALLRAEWKLRRTNAPGISTPLIEKLMRVAKSSGAVAGKVCGAGGGGCVIFFTPPEKRHRVAEAIQRAGGRILPFQVARDGVTVVGGRG